MTNTRNNERIRYRYGICLNEKCEKCKSKDVQEIAARKELACIECGKPLRECPPPRKSNKKKLIIIAFLSALIVIGGAILLLYPESINESTPKPAEEATVAKQEKKDSIKSDNTVNTLVADSLKMSASKAQQEIDSLQAVADSLSKLANQKAIKSPQPTSAPVVPAPKVKAESSMPPAPKASPTSSGTKNLGYATFKGTWPDDVNGRMVFKASHVIDSRDSKGRVAEPGDYVIGEWSDGHLVQGIWYGADNQVKGSIIIGK